MRFFVQIRLVEFYTSKSLFNSNKLFVINRYFHILVEKKKKNQTLIFHTYFFFLLVENLKLPKNTKYLFM